MSCIVSWITISTHDENYKVSNSKSSSFIAYPLLIQYKEPSLDVKLCKYNVMHCISHHIHTMHSSTTTDIKIIHNLLKVSCFTFEVTNVPCQPVKQWSSLEPIKQHHLKLYINYTNSALKPVSKPDSHNPGQLSVWNFSVSIIISNVCCSSAASWQLW